MIPTIIVMRHDSSEEDEVSVKTLHVNDNSPVAFTTHCAQDCYH